MKRVVRRMNSYSPPTVKRVGKTSKPATESTVAQGREELPTVKRERGDELPNSETGITRERGTHSAQTGTTGERHTLCADGTKHTERDTLCADGTKHTEREAHSAQRLPPRKRGSLRRGFTLGREALCAELSLLWYTLLHTLWYTLWYPSCYTP